MKRIAIIAATLALFSAPVLAQGAGGSGSAGSVGGGSTTQQGETSDTGMERPIRRSKKMMKSSRSKKMMHSRRNSKKMMNSGGNM